MMTPSLQYPCDTECPEKFIPKPLPDNVHFLGAILAKTYDPEDQENIYALMKQFPELQKHITVSPNPDFVSFFETIADVIFQHVGK